MNMKKISAATMPEAMKKVKVELGENAVILHSKIVFKGGFMGLFRKKMIEVVAAVDEQPLPVPSTRRNMERKTKVVSSRSNKLIQEDDQKNVERELTAIKKELASFRQSTSLNMNQYPDEIQWFLSKLQAAELAEKHVIKFGDQLLEKWRNERKKPTIADIHNCCNHLIVKELAPISFHRMPIDVKIVNFVGPTGVGKTTTIAKLAATAVLKDKRKVAFITTDTYRIAAIEQLKTYAELLQIPLEVIYDEKDFRPALEKFSDYDLIYIDTAGRNYREKRFVTELKKMFGNEQNIYTFLVLPISMKEQDMCKIVDNFLELHFNEFIFSKADETTSYGVMYNMISHYQTGVAYITTGQDVPDDIIRATPEKIAHYLIGMNDNE
ncbi:flagellar biosynthesis protein FlhF [Lederbergia sp. NSJ-179]|uniref:flagellar biosynthesis protein FlhF n=1 Tax=Lederbergia sp. NSJ-179 TaxID=2931402 RepID=UPI001FD13F6E|nr:flagellar biosynthesis protein FlhF [Lederbergia sp. NSJ-179]MCJ7839657.1 flagellar biosynthesis protein FlhF [Lederbergia sp. NSJ-179]